MMVKGCQMMSWRMVFNIQYSLTAALTNVFCVSDYDSRFFAKNNSKRNWMFEKMSPFYIDLPYELLNDLNVTHSFDDTLRTSHNFWLPLSVTEVANIGRWYIPSKDSSINLCLVFWRDGSLGSSTSWLIGLSPICDVSLKMWRATDCSMLENKNKRSEFIVDCFRIWVGGRRDLKTA